MAVRLELEGRRSDPDVAWRRLGDSDFLNRLANAGALRYEVVATPGGAPRVEGTLPGPFGVSIPFVEVRSGWVRRRWFRQDRSFARGLVAESRFLLTLEPDGDGVRPVMSLEIEPRIGIFGALLGGMVDGYRQAWRRILDALPAPGTSAEPAWTRPIAEPTAAALDRWGRAAPGAVVAAVRHLLLHARDRELRRLRAFAVADRYGLDRMETLVAMLRAVPAGVLELYWSVRCPRCSGEVAASSTLSDLPDHAACPSCRIAFDADLSSSVEVVFAPHPTIAPRVTESFCTYFPSGAPELYATIPLSPGQSAAETVEVPAGAVFRAGPGGDLPDVAVEVLPGGGREVVLDLGAADPVPARQPVAPGAVQLRVTNRTEVDQRVILALAEGSTQIVPASLVATLPEFRRELGPEVVSNRVRVGSRRVCLVFTDLSGSTALYEEIGDAAAFAFVRDHFDALTEVVVAHRGVVVKTIGDAVMASFDAPADGVRASLEMRARLDAFTASRPGLRARPRLNVGVHAGTALAVHTDALGLDWFGRTVNLAARAQGAAKDGALVLTEAVCEDAAVAEVLAPVEPLADWIEVDLKGIGITRLRRLRRPDDERRNDG